MTVTGFFTDSTLCIGCKACEVACKEWNEVPDDGFAWSGLSYDNTVALGHSTWRHVKFVEYETRAGSGGNAVDRMTWQFSSDVCKHCENAGCLESCPTGSILFGDLEELQHVADRRIATLHASGMTDATVWNPTDTTVGGTHAFFLVRGDARDYNLPPKPELPTRLLRPAWTAAAAGAAAMTLGALVAFAFAGKSK